MQLHSLSGFTLKTYIWYLTSFQTPHCEDLHCTLFGFIYHELDYEATNVTGKWDFLGLILSRFVSMLL